MNNLNLDPRNGTQALVSPARMASYLGVTVKTLGRWRRRALIPAVQMPSGQWRYRIADVEAVLLGRPAA